MCNSAARPIIPGVMTAVMLTTIGGIIIRTRVGDINLIGRNTQGVRLIRLDDGDTVGSLAKLPEEELTAEVPDEAPIPADGDGRRASSSAG